MGDEESKRPTFRGSNANIQIKFARIFSADKLVRLQSNQNFGKYIDVCVCVFNAIAAYICWAKKSWDEMYTVFALDIWLHSDTEIQTDTH